MRRPLRHHGQERYGCSNHKSKLPVDGLGGACCSNQKTILRRNREDRVLSCLPAAFFGMVCSMRLPDGPPELRGLDQERSRRAPTHFRGVEGCRTGTAPDHPADQPFAMRKAGRV